jgi:hypothetical protein
MAYKFNPFTGTLDLAGEVGATGTVSAAGSGTAAAPGIAFSADTNTGIFNPSADTYAVATGGVERERIDSSGRLLVGTSTANTSGAKLQTSDGLTFPATQVASADPNTLDDYEEGTWTPTVAGLTTAGTATYTLQTGTYTKIGRLVTITCTAAYSGGTGAGFLIVSNLPFAAANLTNNFGNIGCIGLDNITTSLLNQAYVSIDPNVSYVAVKQFPIGGGALIPVPYDASGGIFFTITYFAA